MRGASPRAITITNLLLPSGLLWIASAGTVSALVTVRPVMDAWTGVPALRAPFGFSARSQTSTVVLPGSSAGLISETLAGTGCATPGTVSVAGAPSLSCWASTLGDVQLGDQRGGVHHGDQGRACGRGLAGKERAVGDYAVDGAANLGIAEFSLGAEVLSLGGVEVSLRISRAALLLTFCNDCRCWLAMSYSACDCTSAALRGIQVAAWYGPWVKSWLRAVTMDWARSRLALAWARSSWLWSCPRARWPWLRSRRWPARRCSCPCCPTPRRQDRCSPAWQAVRLRVRASRAAHRTALPERSPWARLRPAPAG